MTESAKASILDQVVQEGHTDSYGALLYLVAVMGLDPKALRPRTEEELIEWGGHFEGLRAALRCLAMHEQKLAPEKAVMVVNTHIRDAIEALDRSGGAGTAG